MCMECVGLLGALWGQATAIWRLHPFGRAWLVLGAVVIILWAL